MDEIRREMIGYVYLWEWKKRHSSRRMASLRHAYACDRSDYADD